MVLNEIKKSQAAIKIGVSNHKIKNTQKKKKKKKKEHKQKNIITKKYTITNVM
jgi:hypothetical protein